MIPCGQSMVLPGEDGNWNLLQEDLTPPHSGFQKSSALTTSNLRRPSQGDSQPGPLSHPSVLLSLRSKSQGSEGPSCLDTEAQRGKGAGPRSHSNQWRSVASSMPLALCCQQ